MFKNRHSGGVMMTVENPFDNWKEFLSLILYLRVTFCLILWALRLSLVWLTLPQENTFHC